MDKSTKFEPAFFTPFLQSTAGIELPERFTFPFYYTPHPLSLLAAQELQDYLKTQKDWEHNFGIVPNKKGLVIGKMFGVLVIKTAENKLGYLAAFSGKLAGKNDHSRFVPPIFDMLTRDSFFLQEETILNQFNAQIEALEKHPEYLSAQQILATGKKAIEARLEAAKEERRQLKKERKVRRLQGQESLNKEDYATLVETLSGESIRIKNDLKSLSIELGNQLSALQSSVDHFKNQIENLKTTRKNKSAALQQKLFDQYHFLNINGDKKSLVDIFNQTDQKIPPAGSGECAAPKLLQYAFQHNLTPIAMAEFWWGQSPKSEVRRSGHFYPACRGKCKPILGHMLEGLPMDKNPMMENPAEGKTLEVIYEDDQMLVINKPAEFLSVPGKNIQDSVATRMKAKYPDATGPLIVHRLDMSTSGIVLIAKNAEAHRLLQSQFIKRTIKKRYVALLEGKITETQGFIDLPIRVDLDDRPRQLVCYEHGKAARTHWKLIESKDQKTRIHFYPITGRTHQLRVHAAHVDGLNSPIVGDDLYGQKGERLHLHAEWIKFKHPQTQEILTFEISADF